MKPDINNINMEQYLKLAKTISHHMDCYYNHDNPEISDYEYDQLMIQLKAIESRHPEWIFNDSPSQKIGGIAKRESGVKIKHDVPMLSIEDVFEKEDIKAWVSRIKEVHPDCTFSVETKIDGLSMTTRYKSSETGIVKLSVAETRGDGYTGENVTANAKVIPDVIQSIDIDCNELQVRGEVYMSHEDFEAYNREQEMTGKKPAANPRNLAAGTLRQLDPAITKDRRLKFFVFNVQKGPDWLMEDHCRSLDILSNHGIPVVFHKECTTADDIISVIDEIADMRENLDYDIDGAVIKINQVRYRDDFPETSKYSSGHIAYKYPPEERIIVIDDIIVDVGRTGKMTYTGILHDRETGKPARLCGTNVSRVTLHNQDYIREMKIGIGGEYKIYKSGEIIPKLNGCVFEPPEVFETKMECPVCKNPLIKEKDTADIYCINPSCPAQLSRTIEYFCSIDAMNIMGLGSSIIDSLISNGYISTFADIYRLRDFKDELIKNKVFGKEKTTVKVLDAIEKSKNSDPVRLLTGLGIRNVGRSTAKSIMQHFSSILSLMDASYDTLVTIDDIGEITAMNIIRYFDDTENRNIIHRLKEYGVNMDMPVNTDSSEKLAGITFVVTGTLPTLGRKEVTDLIEINGGKCSSSVSKKTDYLVAGEAAGSKLLKANELGVPVITEKDLLDMIS